MKLKILVMILNTLSFFTACFSYWYSGRRIIFLLEAIIAFILFIIFANMISKHNIIKEQMKKKVVEFLIKNGAIKTENDIK